MTHVAGLSRALLVLLSDVRTMHSAAAFLT